MAYSGSGSEQPGIRNPYADPGGTRRLSDRPGSGEAVKALFHSAGDTIRMWEACEAAAPGIPAP